jgi:DNA-binding transcriptional MerR regulator
MSDSRKDRIFYKIGEVCERTETQPYVLRFWESEFPMLRPQKNRAGQRIYREEDIVLIERIKALLYDEEYTIAGARRRLETQGPPTVEGKKRGAARKKARPAEKAAEAEPPPPVPAPAQEGDDQDVAALREQVAALTEERSLRAREAHMAREEADSLRSRLEALQSENAARSQERLLKTLRDQAERLRQDLDQLASALRPVDEEEPGSP